MGALDGGRGSVVSVIACAKSMPSQALALARLCFRPRFRFVERANPNAVRCVGDPVGDLVGDLVGDPSDDDDVVDVFGDSLIFHTSCSQHSFIHLLYKKIFYWFWVYFFWF
jgi:hypothetical protein